MPDLLKIETELDQNSKDLPWGGYDFYKGSKAVICKGEGDVGAVLWTVGPHVRMEIEEACIYRTDDLGLDPPSKGIWIWEGGAYYDNEGTPDFSGVFRLPNTEEWAAIMVNECPWDDKDWKLCLCSRPDTECPKHGVQNGPA